MENENIDEEITRYLERTRDDRSYDIDMLYYYKFRTKNEKLLGELGFRITIAHHQEEYRTGIL